MTGEHCSAAHVEMNEAESYPTGPGCPGSHHLYAGWPDTESDTLDSLETMRNYLECTWKLSRKYLMSFEKYSENEKKQE